MDRELFRHLRRRLVTHRFGLERDLKEIQDRLDAHTRATNAMTRLECCEVSGFMSSEVHRWMFVEGYRAGSDRAIAFLECIVIPEMVVNQTLHRPRSNADGSVTMTPTFVRGREIAGAVVDSYTKDVRLGVFDDVLREPCAECGMEALVVCHHFWDDDSDSQHLRIHRLCVRCPDLQDIASTVVGATGALPFLSVRC